MNITDYFKQPVYLILIVIGALLVFLLLRNWWRRQVIRKQQIDEEDFGKLDKNYRPNRLKELKEDYPGIEEALTWLDTKLMERGKDENAEVGLNQEWCCEDKTGEEEAPMRTRPVEVYYFSDSVNETHLIKGFLEDDYFTIEDGRILRWAIFERCKLLAPMNAYKVHTNKTTRNFTPKEGVTTNWISDTVVKEDYRVEVRPR